MVSPLSTANLQIPYLGNVRAQIPRLLSRMDRESSSTTYGACDRTFWGWKFTDFPGSRFQESLFALAWLYTSAKYGESLYKSSYVIEWIGAGLRYWQCLQHRDGSFDEAYPFERSFAATAFTAFYIGEAHAKLGDSLSSETRNSVAQSLARAADWLCVNDEHHGVLSNHLAAAAAALTVVGRLTGDRRHHKRAEYFLQRIFSRQSAEGWYEEYGGADLGYQTHGSFYLARIWSMTGNQQLLISLQRSVAFLSHFIHPNGTLGGEYGSRNTSFYFPAAFEILASTLSEAAGIAAFMRDSVARQNAPGLAAVDAYNFCPMLNNYLYAHDAAGDIPSPPDLPFEKEGQWNFPAAGLMVLSNATYYAVFAPSKGGVLKVFDKKDGQLRLSDCGYWGRCFHGSNASSQSFSLKNKTTIKNGKAAVRTQFTKINQRVMSPWQFIAFRLFMLTIGRYASIAKILKLYIVKILVTRRSTLPAFLDRSVEFFDTFVKIKDRIYLMESKIGAIWLGGKFSTIHMGSSRYFQSDELSAELIDKTATFQRDYKWETK